MWLLEGLPGVGKSTMAAYLCELARQSGYAAKWYLEESHDHPVHSASLKGKRLDADFIEECLQSWSRFTEQCEKDETVHILEGSAFQSTVRFMMEEKRPAIAHYYQRFEEAVAPLNPRMVYLRPRDAVRHSQYVSMLRGNDWTAKVSGYLENTRHAKHEGLTGTNGMHKFWADYAALCDTLVARTKVPTKNVEFVPGDWRRHMAEANEFFELKAP
ncbi:MAG: hypothetical protein A3I66_18920 [Burkholderiales bacterium RIFCSPLOWO2_02_FULL_57_36]|nr:MAG: hypothetical protein A3I66_18920 [Burkholderiales bacterium RIFCSPLOWO2_02_FULL_57_36]